MSDKSNVAESENVSLAFVVFFSFISLAIGLMCGGCLADRLLRAEAIKADAAEWQIDPKTGATKFVWLPKTEKP